MVKKTSPMIGPTILIFNRWYNTTYALYASMILLYVVLSNIQSEPGEELLNDVERSLELLHVMESITVAKRCGEITREVLEIARKFLRRRERLHETGEASQDKRTSNLTAEQAMDVPTFDMADLPDGAIDSFGLDFFQDDLFAGLLDINLLDGLVDFETIFPGS